MKPKTRPNVWLFVLTPLWGALGAAVYALIRGQRSAAEQSTTAALVMSVMVSAVLIARRIDPPLPEKFVAAVRTPRGALRIGALIVLAGTFLAVFEFHVPRRIVFALSRPAFERIVADAASDQDASRSSPAPDDWVGAYRVQQVAADADGGVYFDIEHYEFGGVVHTEGITFRPGAAPGPFGESSESLVPLEGDWYWFSTRRDR